MDNGDFGPSALESELARHIVNLALALGGVAGLDAHSCADILAALKAAKGITAANRRDENLRQRAAAWICWDKDFELEHKEEIENV